MRGLVLPARPRRSRGAWRTGARSCGRSATRSCGSRRPAGRAAASSGSAQGAQLAARPPVAPAVAGRRRRLGSSTMAASTSPLHAVEGQDVEHALAPVRYHVDELLAVADQHRARCRRSRGWRWRCPRRGSRAGSSKAPADRLELDAGVEQGLDDLQLEQVAVGVPAPAAAPLGVGQRRPDQVGAGPVVELAVGDADDLGRPLAAEAPRLLAAS